MSAATSLDTRAPSNPTADGSPFSLRIRFTRLQLIMILLVVSAISWRRGVYYSGGADVVVVAKAMLTVIALGLAFTLPKPDRRWSQVEVTPVLGLLGYLSIAVISSLLISDETVASMILVIRLSMLAAALVLLARARPWDEVVNAMLVAMLVVVVFATLTGVGTLASGRLEGGIPPIGPNQVCLMFSLPALAVAHRCIFGSATMFDVVSLPLLLGLVWATGSRTGLAALVLAMAIIVVLAPRISIPVFAAAVMSVPAVAAVVGLTSVMAEFVGRGDTASLLTLNSRTVAWSAAIDYPSNLLERLIGGGLALRQIPVSAMYRDTQILDSTWVSAYLQVGLLGVLALVLAIVTTLVAARRCGPTTRGFFVAVIVMLALVSILESGLFDTSVSFIVFFTTTLAIYAHPKRKQMA
ncbi:hypothetical protein FE697_011515 [Mumia zhuanghuii]|uniref:O-antigen ligase n=2 Tax=Mumia TaxID=1546255 RepID=A0ABW1QH95_9ACTN|nr:MULTISPECIES: hypothetical protein [Mumia]KAA1422782.1 hypothetical protein FE697_011515 [Mumia zhuanghuii]